MQCKATGFSLQLRGQLLPLLPSLTDVPGLNCIRVWLETLERQADDRAVSKVLTLPAVLAAS